MLHCSAIGVALREEGVFGRYLVKGPALLSLWLWSAHAVLALLILSNFFLARALMAAFLVQSKMYSGEVQMV